MINRLLFIKLSSLGDILHFLWLVPTLKKCYPKIEISWAVSNHYVDLLKLFPQIDEVIGLKDIPSIKEVLKGLHIKHNLKLLRSRSYEAVIDGQGLLRSGIFSSLVKAKKKIGFAYPDGREGSSWFYTHKIQADKCKNIIDKYALLLEPLGIKELIAERPQVMLPSISDYDENFTGNKINNFFKNNFKSKKKLKILFNPAASFYTKKIPLAVMLQFADLIKKEYNTPLILLTNSDNASEFSALLKNSQEKNILLAPALTIKELLSFINCCDAMIGADSGPTYMAEILGVPSVILFGPTNSNRQSPNNSSLISFSKVFRKESSSMAVSADEFKKKKKHISVYSSYKCPIIKPGEIISPYRCLKRHCADNQCMKQFSGEDILKELQKVL